MNVVVPIHARMSEVEYDRERAQLASTKQEAGIRWEQQLALLFARSGWTQQELAKKEGKGQQWVARQLLFGRFLGFTPMGVKTPIIPNFSERRFRELWSRTDKDAPKEEFRFREVIKLLGESTLTAPRRPQIGPKIKEHFADGKWHSVEAIANKTGEEIDHVIDTLSTMIRLRGTYGCKAERREKGLSVTPNSKFRIFKADKQIASSELAEKLTPIVKELKDCGRSHAASFSQASVIRLAGALQKLLDEWTQ